jgi:hypothetical protein
MATSADIRTSFPMRLIGAMALDPLLYEEVEADQRATPQAFAVVLLSSLGAGIGARGFGGESLPGILFISALSLVAWATWAVVTFEIGSRLMPEPETRVDVGQLLRTIGFAAAPGMLRIFGVVPGATIAAFAITAVWMLAAMIVAVRGALDYRSTARAIAVCVVGWTLAIGIAAAIGLVFGPALS